MLTHNIANILGIENVEKSLEEFHSSETISFLNYLYFLKVELFAQLDKKSKEKPPPPTSPTTHGRHFFKSLAAIKKCDWDKIDEVCWFVCCKKYIVRENKVLSEDDVFQMWRVFNLVAEAEGEEDGELVYPVVIHKEEAQLILEKMTGFLGCPFDPEAFVLKHQETRCFLYDGFLQVVEEACSKGEGKVELDPVMLSLSVGEVFADYITEVLKKVCIHGIVDSSTSPTSQLYGFQSFIERALRRV